MFVGSAGTLSGSGVFQVSLRAKVNVLAVAN